MAYAECESQYKDAVRIALEQVDVIKKMVARYPDTFTFVTTPQGKPLAGKNAIMYDCTKLLLSCKYCTKLLLFVSIVEIPSTSL